MILDKSIKTKDFALEATTLITRIGKSQYKNFKSIIYKDKIISFIENPDSEKISDFNHRAQKLLDVLQAGIESLRGDKSC